MEEGFTLSRSVRVCVGNDVKGGFSVVEVCTVDISGLLIDVSVVVLICDVTPVCGEGIAVVAVAVRSLVSGVEEVVRVCCENVGSPVMDEVVFASPEVERGSPDVADCCGLAVGLSSLEGLSAVLTFSAEKVDTVRGVPSEEVVIGISLGVVRLAV